MSWCDVKISSVISDFSKEDTFPTFTIQHITSFRNYILRWTDILCKSSEVISLWNHHWIILPRRKVYGPKFIKNLHDFMSV
jgi:hypothetical protein